MSEPVTVETLTDEMILEHLDWLRNTPYHNDRERRAIRLGIQRCAAALVPDGHRVVSVWWDAREKLCDAINARRAKEQP